MLTLRKIQSTILTVCISAASMLMTSCNDDDPSQPGNGTSNAQWSDINDVDLAGDMLIYEFDAAASWTATSAETWCTVLTEKGVAGKSSLRLKVEPNDGYMGRSTEVTVNVNGFAEPCRLTVRQGEGFLEKGDGRYRSVNEWMFDFMKEKYLWNEPIPELTLDYSLDYQKFLSSMLNGIAEFDDVNHDDGYWRDGERQAFYSYVSSNAPISRAVGSKNTDSGLYLTATILGENDNDPVGFAIFWVTPGSAAAEAGLKRGDFIDKVNGVAVTELNYQSLGQALLQGNVTVSLNDVKFNNKVATVTSKGSVYVGSSTYTDPAIYSNKVLETTSGKKVGYLLYMGFSTDYDEQLIDIFKQFKAQNVSELILDLRYNPGGEVLASTVMGTLIAGSAHKGQVYVRTVYNAQRTAAGEVGEYKFGEAANPEMGDYTRITEAATNSLNLKKVYVIVSQYTASASELVINGLRGVDIDVNLIGTTTNGKNVGMEGVLGKFGGYSFTFYPITFYCENAKGFRSYSEGFTPELVVDDSTIYPGDFGTSDDILSNMAINWANSGVKPSTGSKATTLSGQRVRTLRSSDEMQSPLSRRQGGSIMKLDR